MFAYRAITLLAMLHITQALPAQAETDWFPLATMADGKAYTYQPLIKASRPWRICALLPHGMDKYWWGVAWGLQQEAERQGLKLGIYQAGSYANLANQRKQLEHCLEIKADAIILAAISAKGLNPQIDQALQQGVPVIDLINGIESPQISAHSRVNFADMTSASVKYLRTRHDLQQTQLAWLPGPADAGWVIDAERGLHQALGAQISQLSHAGYAAPDTNSQMQLVRELFRQQTPDVLLANAVGAFVAARYTQQHQLNTRILAYYTSEPVLEMIRSGQILAAPSDSPVLQARIAIDLASRILEGQPFARDVGPLIDMLDRQSLPGYSLQRLLPPEGSRFIQQALPN